MPQHMTILGAGTALPDSDRDNTSLLWHSADRHLLIDCGGRAYQQMLRANIDPLQLHALFITHTHADHIYGVPALLFHLWLGGYQRTLAIYGNVESITMAQALCEAMQLPQQGHMCAVDWHVVAPTSDTPLFDTDLYSVRTTPVEHSVPCLGLKIVDHETNRTLVHSSDTQPCQALDQFAQGAHTLIHEATIFDPNDRHGHTTPREAGDIAHRAGVERLILIHYSTRYTMPEAEALAEVRAGGFTGEAMAAEELANYPA